MKPAIKAGYKTTYHQDGTVSYWDVYRQQWDRKSAGLIEDEVLASMSSGERARISTH